MHLSQFHYLPLTPGFFSILIALFVGLLVIMIVIGALRHAYLSLGVSPGTAMLLLASLIGSYFNIPIAALPPEIFLTGILAVLLAGLYRPTRPVAQPWA